VEDAAGTEAALISDRISAVEDPTAEGGTCNHISCSQEGDVVNEKLILHADLVDPLICQRRRHFRGVK